MLDDLNMLNLWGKLLSFTKTAVADQALLDILWVVRPLDAKPVN